ncbi:MAG: hypothetical protein V1874_09755 [Spirochaetota bacterium]
MREITSHAPGKTLLWILALSVIWYVFILPVVIQDTTYLLFGWMPLVVVFYNLQTIVWLVSFWVYTSKYWPYR